MKRGALVVPVVLGVLAVTVLAGVSASADSVTHQNNRVCDRPSPGYAGCLAIRHDTIAPITGRAVGNAAPSGYGPTAIRSAYALGAAKSSGRTVAIVDAFDDPKAEADLGVYRKQFGLPACTTANGCFKKVNQTGGTTPPRADGGWAQEISLDLDMVSATCPDCKIRLVEASDNSFTNLGAAVNRAASIAGVKAISNSYGGSDTRATSAYNHPGIAITASTGDSGYGVQSPASYGTVTAVGGTSLFRSSSARGWHETAWNGAGSGCSTLNARPTWQTTATKCSGKASADVSAVADPEHRRRGLRLVRLPGRQGMAGLRRHQCLVTDHRQRLRIVGQHHRLSGELHLAPRHCLDRHHRRQQRHLPDQGVVHGRQGLGRTDRPRHPQGHRRLLIRAGHVSSPSFPWRLRDRVAKHRGLALHVGRDRL